MSILPTYQANLLNRDPIAYMAPKPLAASGAFTVYFTSTESVNNDACTALPDSTPNLANRVVVVQRGTCTYAVKYRNIAAKGGKVVLLYNSPTDLMLPQLNAANGITAVGGLTNEAGKLVSDSKWFKAISPADKAFSFLFLSASLLLQDQLAFPSHLLPYRPPRASCFDQCRHQGQVLWWTRLVSFNIADQAHLKGLY